MRIKVKNEPNLYRDQTTNAIVNTDFNEYTNYLKMRQLKEKEESRISQLENDLKSVKGDIKEIKNLLLKLVQG
jgi:hypothetical protein